MNIEIINIVAEERDYFRNVQLHYSRNGLKENASEMRKHADRLHKVLELYKRDTMIQEEPS